VITIATGLIAFLVSVGTAARLAQYIYSAQASCEHPVDWSAQVECGNQYMRAKKLFEQRWNAEYPASHRGGAEVVSNNGSASGLRK
jgi:hypothetical protein